MKANLLLVQLLVAHFVISGTPLQQLLDSNIVSGFAKGLGGYQGKSARVILTNLSSRKLTVTIENGRRLLCSDTTMQNLLIVKDGEIALGPYETDSIEVEAFCCNATRHAPAENSGFRLNERDRKSWLPLTELFNRKKFDNSSIQNAIWAVSDNRPLSAVFATNDADNQLLRQTVAAIKNEPVPWYYVEYFPAETELVSDKPKLLWGEFGYSVNGNSMVSIVVKNELNEVVKIMREGQPNSSGSHIYTLSLDVMGWKKGKYKVQVISDYSNVAASLPFEL